MSNTSSGVLDTTFSNTGLYSAQLADNGSIDIQFLDVLVDNKDNLVAIASTSSGTLISPSICNPNDFRCTTDSPSLVKFNDDGSLDTFLNGTGKAPILVTHPQADTVLPYETWRVPYSLFEPIFSNATI